MSNLQWFRLYHRIIDDEKIRLIAFEDRWHFIAACCLKADGLLDEPETPLKWRKVAVKLGVQLRELDEIKRRLMEVGLVDEAMQPVAWESLQYRSDTSTERSETSRKSRLREMKTSRNVPEPQRQKQIQIVLRFAQNLRASSTVLGRPIPTRSASATREGVRQGSKAHCAR